MVSVVPSPGPAKPRPTSPRALISRDEKLPFSVSLPSPPKPATLRVVLLVKNEPDSEVAA